MLSVRNHAAIYVDDHRYICAERDIKIVLRLLSEYRFSVIIL